MKALIALSVCAALLAGCAGGNRPSSRQLERIDRALDKAPGAAQPSRIVKAELAFARSAREDGQWTAFRKFAAPDAVISTPGGAVNLSAFLKGRKNPDMAVQWEPRSIWMSCDGSTAVSQGRYSDPQGKVGTYVTVWERQSQIRANDEDETGYRFVYDAAALDNPQPPPKPEVAAPAPGGIVVEAIDAVRADIATCAPRDSIDFTLLNPVPPEPGSAPGSAPETRNSHLSRDATLHWVWTQNAQGALRFGVSLWRKDGWESALTQDLPSAPN